MSESCLRHSVSVPSRLSSAVSSSSSSSAPRVKGMVYNSKLDISRPVQTPFRVVIYDQRDQRQTRYVGQEVGGKPHGQGKCFYKNGSVYDGHWDKGQRHGYGEMRGAPKKVEEGIYETAFYAGHWKCGRRHGFGVQFYSSRSWYEGQWWEGRPTGWGRRVFSDGGAYEGGWIGGKREGVGVYTDAKGGKFEGTWKNDRRHGPGRQWLTQSGLVVMAREGQWAQDNFRAGTLTPKSRR